MAGKGGGAWKVAYADFVTAMMAFFLVMWITAQSNSVKQAIAKYFEHPYDAASRSLTPSKGSSGASLIPLHRDMDGHAPHTDVKGKSALGGGMLSDDQPPDDPANVPRSGGIKKRTGFMLRDDSQQGVGNVIFFSGDSTDLDARAKQSINELAPIFIGKLNKIEIRGHTGKTASDDEAPTSKMWQLSYERCQAVMRQLILQGIEPRRIRLSQAGSYEPDIDGDGQSRFDGARVEVYMLPEYVDDYLGRATPQDTKSDKIAAATDVDKPAPSSAQAAAGPSPVEDGKK
jgi:chemotaxis protein MotB